MSPASQNANLELRVLNFEVPADWAMATGSGTDSEANPHDKLQTFLEKHGLWGEQFRYGCADSTLPADRELMEKGVAASQLNPDGTVNLHSVKESRDYYCNKGFLTGRKQVVIYSSQKLERRGPLSYLVSQQSALVAVVRPVMQP